MPKIIPQRYDLVSIDEVSYFVTHLDEVNDQLICTEAVEENQTRKKFSYREFLSLFRWAHEEKCWLGTRHDRKLEERRGNGADYLEGNAQTRSDDERDNEMRRII